MATPKQQAAKNERLLKEVARIPENKRCAICTAKGPQCTCQPPGIFVCTDCGGVIRKFPGFRIKSRSMATYSTEEIQALRADGNEKFNRTYLGKWNSAAFPPPIDRNPKKIEAFVKQVLVEKNFYEEAPAQPAAPVRQPPSPVPTGGLPKLHSAPRGLPSGGVDLFRTSTSAISLADSIASATVQPTTTEWNAFDTPHAPPKPPSVASAPDTAFAAAFSQTTPKATGSSSFDPFAASTTTPVAAVPITGASSVGLEDAFSVASTSSTLQANQAPSTQWKAFDDDGADASRPGGGQDGASASTEQPSTSPKPKATMKELPLDLFASFVEPPPALPSQPGAFMGSAGGQQMQGAVPGAVPGGMPGVHGQQSSLFPSGQQPQASQPFMPAPGSQGFGQPGNTFQGQGQMPGMFAQPGQQPGYQQGGQQGVAGFQAFGQQPAYQATNQPGMYQQAGGQGGFPQYQGGMPQGQVGFGMGQAMPGGGVMNGMQNPQVPGGGVQPQMGLGGAQPGGLMSAGSLSAPPQQAQGGDNGLFRNLVDDVRGSLPKGQGSANTAGNLGGLGGFGGMPQGGYQPGPTGLQQGYGGAKPGMGQPPLMGQPGLMGQSTLMSQSSLMGTTPQNTFSTSGNPFA